MFDYEIFLAVEITLFENYLSSGFCSFRGVFLRFDRELC